MTTPKGLIIITHPILSDITQADVLNAIPSDWGLLPREIREIRPIRVSMHEIDKIIWSHAAHLQRQEVLSQINPLLEKHPDWSILYFGAAPIPLAVHLGFMLGTWKKFHVFLHHHGRKDWKWVEQSPSQGFQINVSGVPKDTYEGGGDLIIRVQSSFRINPEDTTSIVKNHVKEIDISCAPLALDIFDTTEKLDHMAGEFEKALVEVCNHLPKIETIHLFGAVPVGLAFLLGTKISATIPAKIKTYQFYKDKDPHYDATFFVQHEGLYTPPLTEQEVKDVAALRKEIEGELEGRVKTFIKNIADAGQKTPGQKWVDSILNATNTGIYQSGRWGTFPPVSETILPTSGVDLATTNSEDFYENRKWLLSDQFLLYLMKRLKDKDRILRAIRLFLFHESVHFTTHKLTVNTAAQIGRFPRILEEVDFQADVWAMFHEYAFTKHFDRQAAEKVQDLFMEIVNIATETMWAFDELEDSSTMQSRRITRYLIWYFIYAQIEDDKCATLEHILDILHEKPIIDFKGLKVSADQSQRIICSLTEIKPDELVIALLRNNSIRWHGTAPNLVLPGLVKGLRERNGIAVKDIMKSLYDQVK